LAAAHRRNCRARAAVASKRAEERQQQLAFGDVESGLVFLGLIGMIDPPRPQAVDAIRDCATAGMSVKMITGNHAATALAIAANSVSAFPSQKKPPRSRRRPAPLECVWDKELEAKTPDLP
jgi:P-type E1-E2 ATPase